MTLARTGYGAGTRQLPDRPNVAVATLGTAVTPGIAAAAARTEAVEVLQTNLDDVTGEALGYVIPPRWRPARSTPGSPLPS